MKRSQSPSCEVCGAPAAAVPALAIHQERHYDCERRHAIALCPAHGGALQRGELVLHELVYAWSKQHHDDLYEGTRLILWVEMRCLACNATMPEPEEGATTLRCASCGATNVLGAALGRPAAVRLA